MNQPLSPALLVPERLSAQAVQTARVAALAKGRPLLDVLEEQSGLAPREFSTLLGASFGLRLPQAGEVAALAAIGGVLGWLGAQLSVSLSLRKLD